MRNFPQSSFDKSFNKTRRKIKIIFITIALLIVGGLSLKFFGTFGKYSEGTRTGKVAKFSHQGYLFSTYEGELVLGGIKQGEMPAANVFEFSVADQSVIDTLNANPGAEVTLTYTQYFNVNIAKGKTNYLITSVQVHR